MTEIKKGAFQRVTFQCLAQYSACRGVNGKWGVRGANKREGRWAKNYSMSVTAKRIYRLAYQNTPRP